ncbi:magnesium-dependent phosphatase-1 [Rhizopogon vinicolor AM-OR11-026]|uniref:Magnesium-dependent phosphatase-1 n=1 Tax=Rhizopogon vinicolor AM-OR11-026 TaxID=1314800 RepID=A0A1B7ML14_9AGAM|nr:magnesium-dependent phosphatase-1 [Rhizopogon vinicolor AM-OR11-026]
MTSRLPKLIAFDLDYTLWDFWIDTHVYPPLKRDPTSGKVIDNQRKPQTIDFYRDVPQILHRLQSAGVMIAACSRTDAPPLAREALNLILVPPRAGDNDNDNDNTSAKPIPAIKFFDQLEIYPSSKIRHFKKLHEKTGIDYDEMLFFDDEWRNQEVEELGVTFTLVPNGLNDRILEKGLRDWRKRRPAQVDDDAV